LSIYNPAEAADDLAIAESPPTEAAFYESVNAGTKKKTPSETTLKKVTAEEAAMIRAKVKEQAPPMVPGTNILESLPLGMY